MIFTVLNQKWEKQWKVLRVCLKNLSTVGPSGNRSDYSRDLPRQIFPDNRCGLSTVFTTPGQYWLCRGRPVTTKLQISLSPAKDWKSGGALYLGCCLVVCLVIHLGKGCKKNTRQYSRDVQTIIVRPGPS